MSEALEIYRLIQMIPLQLSFCGQDLPSHSQKLILFLIGLNPPKQYGWFLHLKVLGKNLALVFGFLVDLFDLDRYIDDDQLVVNFKKQDPDLKWPDIMESWESLTAGSPQLLQGTSIYLVGDSTEINQKVAQELATGLGYLESICDFNYQYESSAQ